MSIQNWRGASQKEYTFAAYPIILPCDIGSVARFYIGRPVVYAFLAQDTEGRLFPLYLGASHDGYHRLSVEPHGATAAALDADCIELHVMQAPADEGKRAQIVADLLAANPTSLNAPALVPGGIGYGPRTNDWIRATA